MSEFTESASLFDEYRDSPFDMKEVATTDHSGNVSKKSKRFENEMMPNSSEKREGEDEPLHPYDEVTCLANPVFEQSNALTIDSTRVDKRFDVNTSFEPVEKLGFFSVHIDPDGITETYHPDQSSLKYFYHDVNEEIDLLEGYSSANKFGRVPPGKMHILRWIMANNELPEKLDADFICPARVLRSIMGTPFISKEEWKLIAVKVRESIILNELLTEASVAACNSEERNKGSYAGYRFVEKLTRYQDGSQAPTYAAGNRDSFYTVTKSKVGKHNLLYSNRVDCVIDEEQLKKPFEDMIFVQLKSRSSNWEKNKNTRRRFWQKRVSGWWTEAKCSGIDMIFCGDRRATNDQQLVDKVTEIPASTLPQKTKAWSPEKCFEFLNKTLDFIRDEVTEELTVYSIHCDPENNIICQEIDESVVKHIPSWYINGQSPVDS